MSKPEPTKNEIRKIARETKKLFDNTQGPASNWLLNALQAFDEAIKLAPGR
jgi:hypothetical protein